MLRAPPSPHPTVSVAFFERQLERENPCVPFELGWMPLKCGLSPADLQLGFSGSRLATWISFVRE
jgi:hypothetical protein